MQIKKSGLIVLGYSLLIAILPAFIDRYESIFYFSSDAMISKVVYFDFSYIIYYVTFVIYGLLFSQLIKLEERLYIHILIGLGVILGNMDIIHVYIVKSGFIVKYLTPELLNLSRLLIGYSIGAYVNIRQLRTIT